MNLAKNTLHIALAQNNYKLGDLEKNLAKIEQSVARARNEGVDLVVFSECALSGYLPADMIERPEFIARQLAVLERVARMSDQELGIVVGYIAQNPDSTGKHLQNAVALCHDGAIVGGVAKQLLPTYEIFDEARYFEPADAAQLIDFKGVKLGLSICEDAWNPHGFWERPGYAHDPIEALAKAGADVLINIAASPFELEKPARRRELLGEHARRHGRPLVFVNQVGGHDELIFDGRSVVFDAQGDMALELADFKEDFAIQKITIEASNGQQKSKIDTETNRTQPPEDQAEARKAIVLGLRDYMHKSGFQGAILGLSGGIDSALCAALAAEALGPENILGVAMPTRYTRQMSNTDAELLAKSLGIEFLSIPIEATFGAFLEQMSPVFAGYDEDVTEENLQARIRGTTLMALSNKFGKLVLVPGNKSEFAMGYSTLYGDMVGALSPIGDCFKTLVYEMARGINADAGREVIPARTIERAPSAELRPDQSDQDSLPPYDVLDAILAKFMHDGQSAAELVAAGFEAEVVREVLTKLFRAEYKRLQGAPILRITPRAFGRGRRFPLAASYEELLILK